MIYTPLYHDMLVCVVSLSNAEILGLASFGALWRFSFLLTSLQGTSVIVDKQVALVNFSLFLHRIFIGIIYHSLVIFVLLY